MALELIPNPQGFTVNARVTRGGVGIANIAVWGSSVDHATWGWRSIPSGRTDTQGHVSQMVDAPPGFYEVLVSAWVDGKEVQSPWGRVEVPAQSFAAEVHPTQPVYAPGSIVTTVTTMLANGVPVQTPTWGAIWHESGQVLTVISGPTDSTGRKVVSIQLPADAQPGWYGVGIATFWGQAYSQFYVPPSPMVAGR